MLARGIILGKNFKYSDIYTHSCTYVYMYIYIFHIYIYIYKYTHTHICYLFTHLSVTYLAQRKYTKKEGGEEKDRKT